MFNQGPQLDQGIGRGKKESIISVLVSDIFCYGDPIIPFRTENNIRPFTYILGIQTAHAHQSAEFTKHGIAKKRKRHMSGQLNQEVE